MSILYNTSTPPVQTHTEVLLKTAISEVWHKNIHVNANILLDEGSQKSFISEDLTTQLQIEPNGSATINLATFGETSENVRIMNKSMINFDTEDAKLLPMDVLVVTKTAAPLKSVEAVKLPYLLV